MEKQNIKQRNTSYYKGLDWTLYIGSFIMSLITFTVLIMAYMQDVSRDFFLINSRLYCLCVFNYAVVRQLRNRLTPSDTTLRKGETFIAMWTIITIILAAITSFWFRDRLELLQDVTIQLGILTAILYAGKGVRHLSLDMFGK